MRTSTGIRLSVALTLLAASSACGSGNERERADATCGLIEGDLVISELMIDPDDTRDPNTQITSLAPEWIEIYNASGSPQSLSSVTLSVSGSGAATDYQVATGENLEPGGYRVIGGRNSEGFEYIDISTSMQLRDDGGVASLGCGDVILDQVGWGDRGPLLEPEGGVSWSLDGEAPPSGVLNNDAANWCAEGDAYDGFNIGSPGTGNFVCPETGTRQCDLTAGDLVITEFMARPTDVFDSDTGIGAAQPEWVEFYNASANPVSLARIGLVVAGSGFPNLFELNSGATLQPGEYFVVGGRNSADAPYVDVSSSFQLNNGEGTIAIDCAENVIDEIGYGAKGPLPEPEVGLSLTFDGALQPNSTQNETCANWCAVCGFQSKYRCLQCGAFYCSHRCLGTHK
ncbi:MAG: lamin tail domain-containing protein, partial [Myxococcota bacterium]